MEVSWRERLRQRLVRENRIYVMPTARGVLFLAAVIVLILTAATFNNNLIFILSFFLFALFAVVMLQTHFNIAGTNLEFIMAEETFEGDSLTLLFKVLKRRTQIKNALSLRSVSPKFVTVESQPISLASSEKSANLRVKVLAYKRGVYRIPEMSFETYYPMGLFRAWKIFRPPGQLIVYPKPAGRQFLEPVTSAFGEKDLGLSKSPEGDFGELKNYQIGESYHQIAWKHYARTGQLYSKVHWGQDHNHYNIPCVISKGDLEGSLCQMSAWIQHALSENASFEMHLPSEHIASGSGLTQAQLCWRALALVRGDS